MSHTRDMCGALRRVRQACGESSDAARRDVCERGLGSESVAYGRMVALSVVEAELADLFDRAVCEMPRGRRR